MSSVIRIGTVSKVNYEDGTIEVAYEDRDGSVTDEICVVSNALYRMPVVGAMMIIANQFSIRFLPMASKTNILLYFEILFYQS